MMNTTRSLKFSAPLQKLIATDQVTGKTGKVFKNLGSLSTQNNLLVLRDLMLRYQPQRTLEIGLAFGASCITLATSHRDLGRQPTHQHVAIDPFQSTVWDDFAILLLEQANLLQYVDIQEKSSHIVLPQLLSKQDKFDLIYIDGSHLFEDVFIDFYYSNKLLSKNGFILFDDSTDAHVRKVLKFIDRNFSGTYKKVDISHIHNGFKHAKYILASLAKITQLTVYRKVGRTDRQWDEKFKDF